MAMLKASHLIIDQDPQQVQKKMYQGKKGSPLGEPTPIIRPWMSKNGQVHGIQPNANPKTLTQGGKRGCIDPQLQLHTPPNDQVEESKSEPNDPNMLSPLHFNPVTLGTEPGPNQHHGHHQAQQ
jgi:hypothetical protein